jgi:hypothetical protein
MKLHDLCPALSQYCCLYHKTYKQKQSKQLHMSQIGDSVKIVLLHVVVYNLGFIVGLALFMLAYCKKITP